MQQFKAQKRSLDELLPVLEKYNVRIAVENSWSDTFEFIQILMAEYLEKYMGITYDPGHGNIKEAGGLDHVEPLKHRLQALHLNANDTSGDLHQPPLMGTVDWDRLARIIASSSYTDRPSSFELSMYNTPYFKPELPKNQNLESIREFLADACSRCVKVRKMVESYPLKEGAKNMKIAAQMYSVRDFASRHGYGSALEELAKIGFRSVEHACSFEEFDGKPQELRKFMDSLGIGMVGTHLGTDELFDAEKRKKTVELYTILGAKYLINPWEEKFFDRASQPEYIEKMQEAAADLKQYDMKCGFHNHVNEFLINPATGKTYWATFADATGADVILEQDCGWSTYASQNAAALIRKYPGRSALLHFKPAVMPSQSGSKTAIIGQDSVPWQEIISAGKEAGGTECLVIEQEWYLPGKTDMETIAMSFDGLAKLMK